MDKRIKLCESIAEDMKKDASDFDGKPFTGKTMGEYMGYHGAAIAALADLIKSILEDDNWIKVSDRLPEFGQKVLVFGESKGATPSMGGAYIVLSERQDLKGTMLEKDSHRYQDENNFKHMNYVTHWQPLPNKPKI